jgi:hypothetical protein
MFRSLTYNSLKRALVTQTCILYLYLHFHIWLVGVDLLLDGHEIQSNPEAEFLGEIQTKFLRVFLLAIHSHLYSFLLRFLFLQTQASSYCFYSSVTVHCDKGEGGKPDRNPNSLPYGFRYSYRNLKSKNSQDYGQKPRNCTFMNSTSVFTENVDKLIPDLHELLSSLLPGTLIVLFCINNTSFLAATEDGGMVPISKCVEGDPGYHVKGALVVWWWLRREPCSTRLSS